MTKKQLLNSFQEINNELKSELEITINRAIIKCYKLSIENEESHSTRKEKVDNEYLTRAFIKELKESENLVKTKVSTYLRQMILENSILELRNNPEKER